MEQGTPHDEEISFLDGNVAFLNLKHDLSGMAVEQLKIIMTIHSDGAPFNSQEADINREFHVKRPNVNPLRIDLSLDLRCFNPIDFTGH
jgi:hypothetical protein